MEFTIDTEYYSQDGVGEIALLQLCGPIDQKSVPIFEAEIQELFKNDVCRFVLDLSNTKYLNSSGLGLLINIAHKVNVVGGGIRLVNVAEKFKVLFDMLGLETSLPIYENRDAALRSFGDGELTLKSEAEIENTNVDSPQSESTFSEPLLDEPELDTKTEAVSLLTKKTLPNLKKNLDEIEDTTLKFSVSEETKSPSIYEPDSESDIEDDPTFELTGSIADITDRITDNGIAEDSQTKSEDKPKFKDTSSIKITKPPHIADSTNNDSSVKKEEEQEISVSFIEDSFSDVEEQSNKHEVSPETPINLDIERTKEIKDVPKQEPVVEQTPVENIHRRTQTLKIPKQLVTREVQWYTSVEYYNQMKRFRTFSLMLQVFKVDVVDENKDQLKKLTNTNVMFIPRLPGCQVVPDRVNLDITSENPRAEFWVTPSTVGDIPGWIEIMYEGQTSGFIKAPFRIANYLFAFTSFVLSLLFLCSISINSLNFLGEYQSWGNLSIAFVLLLTSFAFFKRSFPKVDVVEKLLRIKMR